MSARLDRVTISDVARAAAVSVGTVSRVLNNHRSVRPVIRDRVLAEMERLGYEPDLLARSMRTGATKVIGCMVPDVSIPFFSQAVGAAEEALNARGYTMILTNTHDRIDREIEVMSVFRGRRLDGLIATISSEDDDALLGLIGRLGMPVTLLQRVASLPVDSVVNDHMGGVAQATEYLLSLGHRRIAILTGPRQLLPGRERARAFESVLAARGVDAEPELEHFFGSSPEQAYQRTCQMLGSADPPTAIMAGSSQMVGVLRAARRLAVAVPERLSLISLGDMDLAELVTPSLTVVRWNNAETGRAAAETLLARLTDKKEHAPVHIVLPAELVLRASCAPPATTGSIAGSIARGLG